MLCVDGKIVAVVMCRVRACYGSAVPMFHVSMIQSSHEMYLECSTVCSTDERARACCMSVYVWVSERVC